MQKNYRDYTIGELLDMGLKVDINNHAHPSESQSLEMLSKFEGVKKSSTYLDDETLIYRGWKERFSLSIFVEGN